MGAAVGEGFLEAAREAVKLNIPLVIFYFFRWSQNARRNFFINATP